MLLKPSIVNYRDYKDFINDYFWSEFLQEISDPNPGLTNFKDFSDTVQTVLDKHAQLKKRYVRANLFLWLKNQIKLRNKYLKSKSEIDKLRYNKKRNHCLKLLRLGKQKYYEFLNINKITDTKTFLKKPSPSLSTKCCSRN